MLRAILLILLALLLATHAADAAQLQDIHGFGNVTYADPYCPIDSSATITPGVSNVGTMTFTSSFAGPLVFDIGTDTRETTDDQIAVTSTGGTFLIGNTWTAGGNYSLLYDGAGVFHSTATSAT